MKKLVLIAAIAGASVLAHAGDTSQKLTTDEQKTSYGFGMIIGKKLTSDMPAMNIDMFVQGLKDGYSGGPTLMTDEELTQMIQNFQQKQQEAQIAQFEKLAQDNKKAGDAYLKENKAKDGVVTLASGLQYKVIKEGTGAKPGATDTVQVHYRGSLVNGTVFDSSIDRGEPVSFPVNGVIKGWTEALQLMKTGAKWQLSIPSDLAYGPNGNRSIGPNEVLLFDVELLDILKQPH